MQQRIAQRREERQINREFAFGRKFAEHVIAGNGVEAQAGDAGMRAV
jgi:hypothetical protein